MRHHKGANNVPEQASKPAAAPTTSRPQSEDIAVLAYSLWESRGRPEGNPDEDWFKAQETLRDKVEK
jgi:hypothetical protein